MYYLVLLSHNAFSWVNYMSNIFVQYAYFYDILIKISYYL